MAPRVHQKASHGRRSTVRNSESLGQEESMLTTPQPPSNRGHFDACSVLIHCTPYMQTGQTVVSKPISLDVWLQTMMVFDDGENGLQLSNSNTAASLQRPTEIK